ncbi:hypothetical protein CF327_g2853 [Tilletia walkeri]|nr:hypothetical protein CF327_g2853 [Tilletia walkeri]
MDTSTSSAVLVASSDHLVQALQTIEAASRDFNSPDTAVRKRGEATFLSLRDSEAALQYACFALQHSHDAFVLFQMLGLILQQLPILPGQQQQAGTTPTASSSESTTIPSLQHLRDFLLHFVVSRAEAAELARLQHDNNAAARQWPQYVRTRAYQLIAAVSKRMLGTALGTHPPAAYRDIIKHQLDTIKAQILALISLPPGWPLGQPVDDARAFIRAITGLGIYRACLDEFGLTPAGAAAGSSDGLTSLGVTRRGTSSVSDEAAGRRSGASRSRQRDSGSSVGLTGREHLLCKLVAQEELLPDLLSAVLHMLVVELQRPDQHQHIYPHLLFFQLISTLEKLLSWSFILAPSLIANTNNNNGDLSAIPGINGDEENDHEHEASFSPGASGIRIIPSPISSILLSQDLLRLLSASYNAAQTNRSADAIANVVSSSGGTASRASIDAGREASTALHRLRSCILSVARFEAHTVLPAYSELHPGNGGGQQQQPMGTKFMGRSQQDLDLQRQHTEGMLELISALVQSLSDDSSKNAAAPQSILGSMHRGQSLLFVVQLLGTFAAVMDSDPSRLSQSLGLEGISMDSPPPPAFGHFLQMCTRLAIISYDFAFKTSGGRDLADGDEMADLAESCVDQLISSWIILARALLDAIPPSHSQILDAFCAAVREDVVRRYIRGRLQAARGSSPSESDAGEDDVDVESEIGSTAEKDRDRFAEQLRTLAELARLRSAILGPILVDMCELAEGVSGILIGAVQSGSSRPVDSRGMRVLEARWEEAHWLLLMAGYILADDIEGELPAIPSAVEELGADQAASEAHPAVRLIRQLSLTLFDSMSSEVAVSHELSSPQVMESLLWFTNRWLASYLLPAPNEAGEGDLSANDSINAAFSGTSRSQIIVFFSKRAAELIKLWLAEADVLKQTAALIAGFSRCQHAAAELIAIPDFMEIVSAVLSSLDALPVNTHGAFISAIVGTTHTASRWSKTAIEYPATLQQARHINERTSLYTNTITQTLEQRLSSAVHRPDFAAVAQNPTIIQAVQTALDMLEGLALTIQLNLAAGIYDFIARFFPTLIQIVETYSERSEITVLVLKVFRTLAVSTSWAISEDDSAQKQLNEAVWALFVAISRKQNIIGSTEFGAADDDSPYEALCLALETLSGVLELTDTGNIAETPGADRLFGPLSPLHAEDVGMFGFSVLFPSLTADSFSDPRVREKLSRVTCTVWLFFPGRVFSVARAETKPGTLANGLIEVLVRLLSADEVQHVAEALEPIRPLAKAVTKLARDDRARALCSEILPNALDQLIVVLLRSILLEPSEDLDGQIIALRPLLLARASPAFGGQQCLYTSLQSFCANTALHSLREHGLSMSSARQGISGSLDGPPSLTPSEDLRRRELLSGIVASIVQACFASVPAGADEMNRGRPQNVKEAMMRQREERKAENGFAAVVKAQGLLRARRALRIR